MPKTGRPQQTVCAKGHDLSVTRVRLVSGKTFCGSCKKQNAVENLSVSKQQQDAYRARHPERLIDRREKFKKNNPDAGKQASQRYRERHPDYAKNAARKQKYGISPQQYEELLAKECGACAICKRSDVRLCVDHNHVTNEIRGILCLNCNSAIGHFRDSLNLLQSAYEYVRSRGGDL